MSEAQSEPRRRRRPRSSQATRPSYRASLSDARFGKRLFTAMCVLGVVYAATIVHHVREATYLYDMVLLRMTHGDVRYLMGQPTATDDAAGTWRYDRDGRTVVARFGSDGRLASFNCTADAERSFACPAALGVGLGATEDAVRLRLGSPSREGYVAGDKVMIYEGLGLAFRLRRYMVTAIELRDSASTLSYVPRALWIMLP